MPAKKEKTLKHCLTCNKEIFVSPYQVERKKYCSRECQSIGQQKEVSVICRQCGKSFTLLPTLAKKRKYCSYECSRAKRKSIEISCDTCGKSMIKPQCRVNQSEKHYCSRECNKIGKMKDGVNIEQPCATCGKMYKTRIHQVEKRDGKYCSKKCMDAGLRKRKGAQAYYWRKKSAEIRQRDNHTCQNCGLQQVKPALHVHHIIPSRLFGVDNLEQANHPDNLISLCKYCHRKIEGRPNPIFLFRATGLIQKQEPPDK